MGMIMFSLRKIYNYEDDDEEKDNYEDDNPLTCPFSKYLTCLSLLNYIWNCFLLIIFQNEALNRFIFVVDYPIVSFASSQNIFLQLLGH